MQCFYTYSAFVLFSELFSLRERGLRLLEGYLICKTRYVYLTIQTIIGLLIEIKKKWLSYTCLFFGVPIICLRRIISKLLIVNHSSLVHANVWKKSR